MKSLKKMVVAGLLASQTLSPILSHAQEITADTYAENESRAQDAAYLPDQLTADDGVELDDEGKPVAVVIGGQRVELVQENPANAQAPVNNQPNRITTNLTAAPSTSMHFQWHTTDPDEDARLYVWQEGQTIEDAVEFEPELIEIEDAFYVQQTEAGDFVYAIMWDEEEDEPFTDDDNPWYLLEGEVLGYYSDQDFTSDNLQWLDKGFDDYSLTLPYPAFTETAYKVTATDLEPATVYYYAVGNKEGELSEEATFTTADASAEDFTFVHYTDTQNAYSSENQRSEADYSRSTVESILANPEAEEARFAIHSGDVVNDDWNDTEWNLTLDALLPLNNAMPHLYVTGNHDKENFAQHINTDNALADMESGVAYTTRYNGVQFITLNSEQFRESEEDQAPMFLEDQMEWFEEQLQAANEAKEAGEIDWVIVNYHRPMFSASYHGLEDEPTQAVRDDLMALLDEYDVDLVLNGHDHNLSVTHALAYDAEAFGQAVVATEGATDGDVTSFEQPEGTIFIIPNNAGTKTYDTIYKNKSFDWVMEEEDIDETYADLFDYEVTEQDIDHYRQLLLTEEQPFLSPYYEDGHSNARESNIQHYGLVEVTANSISYKLFEVVGEDLAKRETNLVHTYVINK